MDGAERPDPGRAAAPSRPEGLPEPEARAPAAAAHWLRASAAAVDETFGEGHAARHPELVAAMVQACAIETAVDEGRGTSARVLETLRSLSRETNATILKLKPKLFG